MHICKKKERDFKRQRHTDKGHRVNRPTEEQKK